MPVADAVAITNDLFCNHIATNHSLKNFAHQNSTKGITAMTGAVIGIGNIGKIVYIQECTIIPYEQIRFRKRQRPQPQPRHHTDGRKDPLKKARVCLKEQATPCPAKTAAVQDIQQDSRIPGGIKQDCL